MLNKGDLSDFRAAGSWMDEEADVNQPKWQSVNLKSEVTPLTFHVDGRGMPTSPLPPLSPSDLLDRSGDVLGPTRASTFPETHEGRKTHPVATGVLDYFPDALVAIAHLSWAANEQHNPGTPVHWSRQKSTDEADALMRHFLQRGTIDKDGLRHSTKMAWRALALLQKEIEGAG